MPLGPVFKSKIPVGRIQDSTEEDDYVPVDDRPLAGPREAN